MGMVALSIGRYEYSQQPVKEYILFWDIGAWNCTRNPASPPVMEADTLTGVGNWLYTVLIQNNDSELSDWIRYLFGA